MINNIKIMRNGREITLGQLQDIVQRNTDTANLGFRDICDAHVIRGGIGTSGAKFGGRFDFINHGHVQVGNDFVRMREFFNVVEGNPINLEKGLEEQVKAMIVSEGLPSIKQRHFKWKDYIENLVVNDGLQHILDVLLTSATAKLSTWYIGLVQDNSASSYGAAGDTMASHAGWTETAVYSEGIRRPYEDVRSGQSVDNSATKAVFSINGSDTIAGAFISSDSTKSGSSGTLLCVGGFSTGDKIVTSGDTLQVTYTFTAADDGV